MADQAESLRKIVLQSIAPRRRKRRGKLIVVFGAEPAMGASMLSLQLALAWLRRDEAAALLDLSRHQLPLQALRTAAARLMFRDVMSQQRTLREAWLTGPCGVPVAGGDLQDDQLDIDHPLLNQLKLATEQQHVLVDLQAIDDLRILLPVADHCVFVSTAEAERLTATYRAIKSTVGHLQGARCWLAMSQVIDSTAAKDLQDRLVLACDRCLNLAVGPLGCLPWDPGLASESNLASALAGALRPSPYRHSIDRILIRLDEANRQSPHRNATSLAV